MGHVRNGMPAPDLGAVTWQKSSYSGAQGQCVEVAGLAGGEVAVRNSRDTEGPALVFTPEEMTAFVRGAKSGEFDHLI